MKKKKQQGLESEENNDTQWSTVISNANSGNQADMVSQVRRRQQVLF